jgi:hypothetical protein
MLHEMPVSDCRPHPDFDHKWRLTVVGIKPLSKVRVVPPCCRVSFKFEMPDKRMRTLATSVQCECPLAKRKREGEPIPAPQFSPAPLAKKPRQNLAAGAVSSASPAPSSSSSNTSGTAVSVAVPAPPVAREPLPSMPAPAPPANPKERKMQQATTQQLCAELSFHKTVREEEVRSLIKAGADPWLVQEGVSPLHIAVRYGQAAALEHMLRAGGGAARPMPVTPGKRLTPLLQLAHMADPAEKKPLGASAQVAIARLLLAARACIESESGRQREEAHEGGDAVSVGSPPRISCLAPLRRPATRWTTPTPRAGRR